MDQHGWRRVRRGVYLLPGHTLSKLAQLKAAELALQGEGVACGRSAALPWGLVERLYRPMEFMVDPACSRRPEGTVVARAAWLDPDAVVLRQGIMVPSAALTIGTCGARMAVGELARMIARADRMRVCPRSTVRETIVALPYLKGRRFVVQALDELDGRGLSHSDLEKLGRRRLGEAGFMPHGRPHLVTDDAGRPVGEIDIAFLDEKIGIPIDGPHHFEPGQKRADDDQRHKLRLLGWIIIPADEHRLVHEPRVFIRQVLEALADRRSNIA